ncbi:helix-turn-helix domain-containing protein [Phytohabitans flavus]|uniref:helix-turn-helix domain-containing protein n=1 Tax=Phytohabitans flavus TaxID=1076124 RepID=UPI0036297B23
MTTVHGPTVGRRRLRSALRRARDAAGLTQEQVAAAMDWSLSKLIRIEAGSVSISTNDVKALLGHYRMTDQRQVNDLVELARVSRRRTWWSQYKDTLPSAYASYIGLETEASRLSFFQSSGIPGLLQTPAYARAAVTAASTTVADTIGDDEIEVRHAIRMRRQKEVLERPDRPDVDVVLGEAALHRQTGGPEVLREQLLHLAEMGRLPRVTIHVLPFTVGDYAPQGPFVILHFPDEDDSDVVYLEGVLAQDVLDRPADVAAYRQTFERMREMSLDPHKSLAKITKVAGQLG